jgi:hypothetical protein
MSRALTPRRAECCPYSEPDGDVVEKCRGLKEWLLENDRAAKPLFVREVQVGLDLVIEDVQPLETWRDPTAEEEGEQTAAQAFYDFAVAILFRDSGIEPEQAKGNLCRLHSEGLAETLRELNRAFENHEPGDIPISKLLAESLCSLAMIWTFWDYIPAERLEEMDGALRDNCDWLDFFVMGRPLPARLASTPGGRAAAAMRSRLN